MASHFVQLPHLVSLSPPTLYPPTTQAQTLSDDPQGSYRAAYGARAYWGVRPCFWFFGVPGGGQQVLLAALAAAVTSNKLILLLILNPSPPQNHPTLEKNIPNKPKNQKATCSASRA
jgi:hypothetical protein